MIWLPFFYVLLFSIYCWRGPDDDFEPMLNVCGVLRNETNSFKLLVDRTYRIDEQPDFDQSRIAVFLFDSSLADTHVASLVSYDDKQYHEIRGLQVNAGATYHLMVYADGYDTVFGRTTVPGDYHILTPSDSDTITVLDTLVFTVGEGVAEYVIECIGEQLWSQYYVYPDSNDDDSIISLPLYLFPPYSQTVKFIINGHDSSIFNYFHYYDSDDPPRCGVTGGIGLFGSAWVKSVDVYLKVD